MCCVFANGVNTLYAQDEDGRENLNFALSQIVVESPKDAIRLNKQPISTTQIDSEEMEQQQITSVKGLSNVVPGFFMPDYGSRLTSALYIRGVGSRMNTPAVGLYVDGIPYYDKSAFDFNFYDIESIDVLRGPQATLYGRNTMGGLINVHTKSPFAFQGTDVKLGYSTGDNHRSVSLTHYHRPSKNLAFSAGGYYEGSDGFFENDITGRPVDEVQAGGGRIRAMCFASDNLKFDYSIAYDYSDEGAYPYFYVGNVDKSVLEPYPNYVDKISNNRESRYRRGMLNTGLDIRYTPSNLVLTSTTGFQNLNDCMDLDQDFIGEDIYTIQQKQRLSILSEEIILRNSYTAKEILNSLMDKPVWNWLFGASGSYQWLKTEGPVTFYPDGKKQMIEDNVNSIFSSIKATNPSMPDMGLKITDSQFSVPSDMNTPALSAGIFHQSTLRYRNWSFVAGLRLEYEKMKLDYLSSCPLNYEFSISMPPYMSKTYTDLLANSLLEGKMSDDYLQLLPKLSLSYSFGSMPSALSENSVFASVSKGYRSGGYNVQMFSDLVQGDTRNQMIDGVNSVSQGMMARFVDIDNIKTVVDVDAVRYSPEYSWNFELGTKLYFPSSDYKYSCNLSAALYYIKTYDQQIARFSPTGLGRMMVNAGKSESYGAELSLTSHLPWFDSNLSYGFTRATFKDYNDGTNDYAKNYVPFVPMHTISFSLSREISRHLVLGADFSGAGRIYWTESNNAYQNFYATLGAFATVRLHPVFITFWGRNLTASKYNTFYFESAGRAFEQHSKPLHVGVTLKMEL